MPGCVVLPGGFIVRAGHDRSSNQYLRLRVDKNTVCLNSIREKRHRPMQSTMQINQAIAHTSFSVQASEVRFSSVWGNEMQREDFLALAAGVRQFSAGMALAAGSADCPLGSVQRAAE
jgi:hypothetical protein